MRNAKGRRPVFQIVFLDHCVNAGFYALVIGAAFAFGATWWLPQAQTEEYMAASWICVFGAALCLLMRLAVLVWQDQGDPGADRVG